MVARGLLVARTSMARFMVVLDAAQQHCGGHVDLLVGAIEPASRRRIA